MGTLIIRTRQMIIQEVHGFSSLISLFPENTTLNVLMAGDHWNIPTTCNSTTQNAFNSIPISGDGRDKCIAWGSDNIHKFGSFIEEFYSFQEDVMWSKVVWHKHHALRFSIYAWLCFVGGLKTSDALRKRNIEVDPKCVFCHCHEESVSHLFFECDYTFSIISKMLPAITSFLLRPNLHQISDFLSNSVLLNYGSLSVNLLMLWAAVYSIWHERNERKFANRTRSISNLKLLISKVVDIKLRRWKKF
ncbi:hypothetical protein KFK09_013966 [Dendrobium nobile]|uniref:Reverse transcriptase zinc-binding domain-containing protein n=1 Tax=Dendrobium nobile TaxID=94219 RepID=A0A8T3BAJ1_DENNO|nr:hypothetical protein KFK09_013966 [Dendrobium nobile]